MKHDPAAEAEEAYRNWRIKAADVLLVVIGLSILPQNITWILGYDLPPAAWWFPMMLAVVILALAATRFRRVPLGARVWLLLLVMYTASIHGFLWYSGAMARVWLAGAPVLALILVGQRSGAIAALISIGLITLHAAASLSGVTAALQVPGFDESLPRVVVSRSVMWVAFFIPLMLLLHKLRVFEMRTLKAERAAAARLAQEVSERRAAHESLARAASERERLEREIARVGDEERHRLGHDLHDGPNQQLALALLRCTALEKRLAAQYPAGLEDARALATLLESAMDEVHEVAEGLIADSMDPADLRAALETMVQRAGERYRVRCDYRQLGCAQPPTKEAALDLYHIAQEAVNNAGQHAQAQHIAVTLARVDGHLRLVIEDDGVGLPASIPSDRLGLRIMEYRARRIGGTLEVERRSRGGTRGTRVVCQVPKGPCA